MEIWKYEVLPDIKSIEMPHGSKILHLNVQNGIPCIWALVDPTNFSIKRNFYIVGTGHPIDRQNNENLLYLGTFLLNNDSLVFHLFEITKE